MAEGGELEEIYAVDDSELTEEDVFPLKQELIDVAAKWRAIGLALGLRASTLDTVRVSSPSSPEECLTNILTRWTREVGRNGPPTWRRVVKAVADKAGGNNHALALKIARNHPVPSTGSTASSTGTSSPENMYVARYAEDLKRRYCRLPVIPKETEFLCIGKYDTQVALIEYEYEKQQSIACAAEDRVLGRVDQITARKKSIKAEEIFTDPTSADTYGELRILIDGAPGVGKTTQSRRFVIDWAKGKLLTEYQLVVLLPLRDRRIRKATSLDEFFYHDDPKVLEEVISYIRKTSGRHLMLIFDGFDELSRKQREEESLFLEIISGEKLSNCSVVVTSRPYASRGVQRFSSLSRHIEVLGFTKEQIVSCIHKNMEEESQADDLVRKMMDRQDLISLCYVPLNCAIVMFVYTCCNCKLPDTLTQLYEMLLVNVLKRHADKYKVEVATKVRDLVKLPSALQKCLDGLSKLAYDGMKEDKSVFLMEDLESELSEIAILSPETDFHVKLLGLMTSFQSMSGYGREENYQFLHRTIQEFLAARHTASLPIADQMSLLFSSPDWWKDGHMKIMRLFVAGISKLRDETYLKCFTVNFVLDCDLLRHELMTRDFRRAFLQYLHVVYEAQNDSLCKMLTVKEHIICMKNIRLSAFDCKILAYYLLHSGHDCKCLDLTTCYITDACLEVFKEMSSGSEPISHVQELILCDSRLSTSTELEFSCKGLSIITSTPLFENLQVMKIHLNCMFQRELSAELCSLRVLQSLTVCLNSRRLKQTPSPSNELVMLQCFLARTKTLQSLELKICNVSAIDIDCLARGLETNTTLTSLSIHIQSQRDALLHTLNHCYALLPVLLKRKNPTGTSCYTAFKVSFK